MYTAFYKKKHEKMKQIDWLKYQLKMPAHNVGVSSKLIYLENKKHLIIIYLN